MPDIDPKVIWLMPWCEECQRQWGHHHDRRLWSPHKDFNKCEGCGRKPVRYVIDGGGNE